MTKVTEILEQIQTVLKSQMNFPNFGSVLDMDKETLSISIVDTDIHLVVQSEINPSVPFPAYFRLFDSSNVNFIDGDESNQLNRVFLDCQERYLNHRLHAYGHVFLNEVYDALGFPRIPAGQIVGWLDNDGAGHIDFGLQPEQNKAFIEGRSKEAVLDFNVQGIIFKEI